MSNFNSIPISINLWYTSYKELHIVITFPKEGGPNPAVLQYRDNPRPRSSKLEHLAIHQKSD